MKIYLVYKIFDNGIWDEYFNELEKAFKNKDNAIKYMKKRLKEENNEKYIYFTLQEMIVE